MKHQDNRQTIKPEISEISTFTCAAPPILLNSVPGGFLEEASKKNASLSDLIIQGLSDKSNSNTKCSPISNIPLLSPMKFMY